MIRNCFSNRNSGCAPILEGLFKKIEKGRPIFYGDLYQRKGDLYPPPSPSCFNRLQPSMEQCKPKFVP